MDDSPDPLFGLAERVPTIEEIQRFRSIAPSAFERLVEHGAELAHRLRRVDNGPDDATSLTRESRLRMVFDESEIVGLVKWLEDDGVVGVVDFLVGAMATSASVDDAYKLLRLSPSAPEELTGMFRDSLRFSLSHGEWGSLWHLLVCLFSEDVSRAYNPTRRPTGDDSGESGDDLYPDFPKEAAGWNRFEDSKNPVLPIRAFIDPRHRREEPTDPDPDPDASSTREYRTLYHGTFWWSAMEIGRNGPTRNAVWHGELGRGFYLGTNYKQALSWAEDLWANEPRIRRLAGALKIPYEAPYNLLRPVVVRFKMKRDDFEALKNHDGVYDWYIHQSDPEYRKLHQWKWTSLDDTEFWKGSLNPFRHASLFITPLVGNYAERVRLFIRKCFETKVNLLFMHALFDGQVGDALNVLYNEIEDGGHVMANIDTKWASSSGLKRLHSVLAVLLLLDSSSSADRTKYLEVCLASAPPLAKIVKVFDTDPSKRDTGRSYRRQVTWDLILIMVKAIYTNNEADFITVGELLLQQSSISEKDDRDPYTDFRALRTWVALLAYKKLNDKKLQIKGEELVAQCSEIFGPDSASSKPQGHKLTSEDLDKVAEMLKKFGK